MLLLVCWWPLCWLFVWSLDGRMAYLLHFTCIVLRWFAYLCSSLWLNKSERNMKEGQTAASLEFTRAWTKLAACRRRGAQCRREKTPPRLWIRSPSALSPCMRKSRRLQSDISLCCADLLVEMSAVAGAQHEITQSSDGNLWKFDRNPETCFFLKSLYFPGNVRIYWAFPTFSFVRGCVFVPVHVFLGVRWPHRVSVHVRSCSPLVFVRFQHQCCALILLLVLIAWTFYVRGYCSGSIWVIMIQEWFHSATKQQTLGPSSTHINACKPPQVMMNKQ